MLGTNCKYKVQHTWCAGSCITEEAVAVVRLADDIFQRVAISINLTGLRVEVNFTHRCLSVDVIKKGYEE